MPAHRALRALPCKKTRAAPREGRAAARLHRQPIPPTLTTPPGGTRKRSIAVQETGRCGCADGPVVTGGRLDVRDLAQIPGGHLGAGLLKVLSTVVSRRYEGTYEDASIKDQPGHPAARGPGVEHLPQVRLDLADAAELAEMLTFLPGWLPRSQKPRPRPEPGRLRRPPRQQR